MDSERWKEIERIFLAAVENDDASRGRLLDELCAGDDDLRVEVEAMLAAGGDEGRLRIEDWLEDREGSHGGEAPQGGALVGPYRLIRVLGEGGMGVVWLAEQTSPMRRMVALKIVKLGMDTRQVVARFESERQALALMAHPNIAQVFDAGATPDGRPYFVMEYVEGENVNRHCDERRLTARRRIELFLQVCKGAQHAHLKGIIHRDLKPSNVIVTDRDGESVPKIIDFGIAKATVEGLTDGALVTRTGYVLGTPVYMSPEQARTGERDVDTRTDVYSLGVMLYELLAGALPADPGEIAEHALRRSLDELRFPRPSARLTSLPDTGQSVARNRRTTLESLTRTLQGDLDWIILEAIARDKERRYSSVEALANDLRRYLSHEPVQARPPSVLYEARKFVRRHRVGVVAASAVVLALLAGAGLATHGMVRALAAEAAARRDAESARRIKDFIVGIFDENDPYRSAGEKVTARELLDRGAEQLRHELADEPVVRADVMSAVGRAYISLGLYDRAEPVLASVLEERESRAGEGGPALAETLSDTGELRFYQARYDEAFDFLERSLAIREATLGPNDEDVAWTLSWLGRTYAAVADYPKAREIERRVLAIHRSNSADREAVSSLRQLGVLASYEGRNEEALEIYEEALALARDALGDEHPLTLDVRESMALTQDNLGDSAAAEETQRSVLEARKRVFGGMHPTVAYSYHNLGRTLAGMGRHEEAVPLFERSVEIREHVFGAVHPTVAHSLESLAISRATTGDLDAAAKLFERALAIYRDTLGPSHPETLESLQNLAMLAVYQGDEALAEERMAEAVRLGCRDLEIMLAPPLDALVGRPGYDALVERVRGSAGSP